MYELKQGLSAKRVNNVIDLFSCFVFVRAASVRQVLIRVWLLLTVTLLGEMACS